MSLHLVTGCAGEAHITSADQGAYNMATYGGGEFVLDRGNKFVTTLVSNNAITVADGEAMMQGRYIRMTPGTSETVAIDNGSTGMKRNDLICLRYEKDISTGFESASLSVVKGTPSSSTPTDPSYTHGDITDDDDPVNEMPLYRVYINGLNIETITPLFTVKVSMVDYMDEYQLPVAAANRLGGVKIGSNISIADDGKISVGDATTSAKGVMKVGTGLSVSSGTVSLKSATSGEVGGIKVSSPFSMSNGVLGIQDASTTQKGIVKVGDGLMISSSNALTLRAATNSQYGGIKVGSGLYLNGGVLAVRTNHTMINVYPDASTTIDANKTSLVKLKYTASSDGDTIYLAMTNSRGFPVCGLCESDIPGVRMDVVYYHTNSGLNLYFYAYIYNTKSSSVTVSTSQMFRLDIVYFTSTY